MTSFVGRERELVNLHELLASNHYVTLVGLGGTGKTRLMLRAAAATHARLPRRGLARRTCADRGPGTPSGGGVHGCRRVRPAPGQPALDALIDFLRAKTLLLAIDNCEHVIAAAAEFAEEVLQACPRVALLVSSREPLGVVGEQSFARAAAGARNGRCRPRGPCRQQQGAPASRERRQVVRAAGVGRGARVPAIRRERRRGGRDLPPPRRHPTRPELAAARVNVLSVNDISRRLGDRFRLLTGGRRTASPRQRTLQAAMAWSWVLLGERDGGLLRRMAVFSGGWPLDRLRAIGRLRRGDGRRRPRARGPRRAGAPASIAPS